MPDDIQISSATALDTYTPNTFCDRFHTFNRSHDRFLITEHTADELISRL